NFGLYVPRHFRVPFTFTRHANDLLQRRSLLKLKLRRATFVTCISEWHRDLYRAIEPDSGSRYQLIRCRVEVQPDAGSRIATDNCFHVLTVCRLVEKKGVDTLI